MPKFKDSDTDQLEEQALRNAAKEDLNNRLGLRTFIGSLSGSASSYAKENIARLCAEIDKIQGSTGRTINDYDQDIARRQKFLADLRSGKVPYTTTLSAVQQDIKMLEERKKRALNISTVQTDILKQYLDQQIEREAKRRLEQEYGRFLKDVSVGGSLLKVDINIKRLEEKIKQLREVQANTFGADSKNASLARKSENRILELEIKSMEEVLEIQKESLLKIQSPESNSLAPAGEGGEGLGLPKPTLEDTQAEAADIPTRHFEDISGELGKTAENLFTSRQMAKKPNKQTVERLERREIQEPKAPKLDEKELRTALRKNISTISKIKEEYLSDLNKGWVGYFQYRTGTQAKQNRLLQLDVLQHLATNINKLDKQGVDAQEQNLILLGALVNYRDFLIAEASDRWISDFGTSAITIVNKQIAAIAKSLSEIENKDKVLIENPFAREKAALESYKRFTKTSDLKEFTSINDDKILMNMKPKEVEAPKPKQRNP